VLPEFVVLVDRSGGGQIVPAALVIKALPQMRALAAKVHGPFLGRLSPSGHIKTTRLNPA